MPPAKVLIPVALVASQGTGAALQAHLLCVVWVASALVPMEGWSQLTQKGIARRPA